MKKIDLKQCQGWYADSEYTQNVWKTDSWNDSAFADGEQWSEVDRQAMEQKGIKALTINRIFSVLQSAKGHQVNNRTDIIAKGRTQHDQAMSQVMSQAIEYVGDKNDMDARISGRFTDQVIAGIGFLAVTVNPDPTAEPVQIKSLPWYSVGWDIYAQEGPWLKQGNCRYVYYTDWKDLDDVLERFPKKKREIEEFYGEAESFTGQSLYNSTDFLEDFLANNTMSGWTQTSGDTQRKRIKLVDMWYPQMETRLFAKLVSGQVVEVDEDLSPQETFQIIDQAESVFHSPVAKMQLRTFAGKVDLQSIPSPFKHNNYPFVPFVAYTDRYHQPYGIPRNLTESAQELNKRRSMALSLISNRRVIMEEGSALDHQLAYEEANKQDGFIVLEDGKSDTFKIQEMADLAPAQMDLMHQAEQEIKEVSGANDESLGYQTKVQSGVAIAEKKESSVTMLSPVFDNLSRSKKILGELIMATVQQTWTGQRVLLVTDSMTGAEKFMNLNEPTKDKISGEIVLNNDITAGTFDVIVDNAGDSSTERERQAEFIMSALQKSPPELAGPLITMGLELSNLPHKDQLMRQIRQVTRSEPIDTFLTQDEVEEKDAQRQQEMDAQQQVEEQNAEQLHQLEVQRAQAEIDKIYADIDIQNKEATANQAYNADKVDLESNKQSSADYMAGVKLAQDIERQMGLSMPKLPMSQPQDKTYPTQ